MGGEERGEKCGVVQPKALRDFSTWGCEELGKRGFQIDGEQLAGLGWDGLIGAGICWGMGGNDGLSALPSSFAGWILLRIAELKQWDGKRWELGSVAASHPRNR